jgi:hypothetical protein
LEEKASSAELKNASDRLLNVLPQNLPDEPDDALRAGFAGWAVLGVATIALKEAPDVQDSILQSAVVHAARSVVGPCRREFWEGPDTWSAEERQFLCDWWERCCVAFPKLRGG